MRGRGAASAVCVVMLGACASGPLRGAALNEHLQDACYAAKTVADRRVLEEELLPHVRLEVRPRAIDSVELAARSGTKLYDDDVVLLSYDALNHAQPCCSTITEVTLATGGREWEPLRGAALWRYAGLEPPVPGRVTMPRNWSDGGLLADAFVALLTMGLVDARFRGEGEMKATPGRAGTGTREQKTAIAIIGATLTTAPEEAFPLQPANHVALIAPPSDAEGPQELIVRVTFGLAERGVAYGERCPLVVERRLAIPAGSEPTGTRLQRLVEAEGPIVIGSLEP